MLQKNTDNRNTRGLFNICLKKLLKRTKPKYIFSLDLMSEKNAFFVHRNLRGKQGLCVIGPLRVGSC